jgi:hypothetical protein
MVARGRLGLLLAVAIAGLIAAPTPAVAARHGTKRPIAGTAAGTNAISVATGTFTSDATGHVSHLGRTSFHIQGTFGFTASAVAVSGLMTMTSASGDRLTGDFDGSGTAGAGTIDITATFRPRGGTGRFAHARGLLSGTVHEQTLSLAGGVLTNATEFRFSGHLIY